MSDSPTRRRILECAVRLLGSSGPEGFTAAALAREAGVSKANVYHHFQSLDDVVLEAFDATAMGMVGQASAGGTVQDWILSLGEGVFALADQGELGRAYLAFSLKALHDPRLRARMVATHDQAREAAVGHLATLCSLDRAGRSELVELVFVALDGLLLNVSLAAAERGEQRAAWRRLADHLAPREDS